MLNFQKNAILSAFLNMQLQFFRYELWVNLQFFGFDLPQNLN